MQSKYFTFYKITNKSELVVGIRVRNFVLNLQYYKIPKKLNYNFYKIAWPIDMSVLTLWKQIDWR